MSDDRIIGQERIRVLHLICPTGLYGAERWILALASALEGSAVHSELAVTSERRSARIEVLERFPGSADDRHRIEMSGRFDLSAVAALVRIIRTRGVDVVHTHGYKSDLLGLVAARRAGIRCVSTPHGFGHDIDFKLRVFIRIGAFALRYFDKVSPLSNELAADVRRLGVPARKVKYIANGTDLVEIADAARTHRPDPSRRGVRIGYVGQLIPRKQIRDILVAFDAVWRQHPAAELVIAGDGIERSALEAAARALQSGGAISFTGYVEDRLTLMLTFDLFVMASSSEGIPRCAMEAMGLGLPVLAYDIPGVDQLVLHGETGVLVPLNDREALAAAARELVDDADRRRAYGRRGKEEVESRFSASLMASEYTALYTEMLGKSTGDSAG